jgi:hypothetical protein
MLRTLALEALLTVQRPDPIDNHLVVLHGMERLATALGHTWRYHRLLLFPTGLSADYSGDALPRATGLTPEALLGAAALLSWTALALAPRIGGWRRRARSPAPGAACFAAALFLLPFLVVGNLLVPVGAAFAERLIYLPSAGFCLLAGLLLGRMHGAGRASRRALVTGILAAILGGLGVASWQRAQDWESEEKLFAAAAAVMPRAPRAHFIVGRMEAERGRTKEAHEHLARTVTLWPDHAWAWFEIGLIHGRGGDLERAGEAFARAVRILPDYAAAHLNLGVAFFRQGRFEEAEPPLRKALLQDPSLARAWATLGHLRHREGRFAEAAACYRRAVGLGMREVAPDLEAALERAGDRLRP